MDQVHELARCWKGNGMREPMQGASSVANGKMKKTTSKSTDLEWEFQYDLEHDSMRDLEGEVWADVPNAMVCLLAQCLERTWPGKPSRECKRRPWAAYACEHLTALEPDRLTVTCE